MTKCFKKLPKKLLKEYKKNISWSVFFSNFFSEFTCLSRGLFSVGNKLSELLINTEMAFCKGNQMSIEGRSCSLEGTTLLSWQKAT